MNLTKQKIRAAKIAVDTIDFIEKKVHEVVQNENEKDKLIDYIVELVNNHYNSN